MTYDAYSTHCDTVDLWSKLGMAAVALMLVGTILFSAGTLFFATSDRDEIAEEVRQKQIENNQHQSQSVKPASQSGRNVGMLKQDIEVKARLMM